MAYIQHATRDDRRRARTAPGPAPRANRSKSLDPTCLFCRVGAGRRDRQELVLLRRPRAFLMLNRYPYNPGHLMVAVLEHKAQFTEITRPESRDLIELVAIAERALAAEYRPHGVNYGVNVGRVAGAGFPGHLHVHVVPRWDGDTNFMPVVGETRVLPESLEQTWRRLRRAVRAEAPRRAARDGR